MKPHIKLIDGEWWCYTKPQINMVAKYAGSGSTPAKAYADYIKTNARPTGRSRYKE